jgi:hypothetical protein
MCLLREGLTVNPYNRNPTWSDGMADLGDMDKKARKQRPMARGLLDYFPDACAEVAHTSYIGNEQHNPGQELHWAKEKSTDHADCIVRHLVGRGTMDSDGIRHTAKVAWRALALLQTEIEAERPPKFKGVTLRNIKTGQEVNFEAGQTFKVDNPDDWEAV